MIPLIVIPLSGAHCTINLTEIFNDRLTFLQPTIERVSSDFVVIRLLLSKIG
jgi:hypothetical protein